jgi:hypothetical protein
LFLDLSQSVGGKLRLASPDPIREASMKIWLVVVAVLSGGMGMLATTESAQAVVYCTYVGYPVNCVARRGVVLRPRPVGVGVATPGVGRTGVPGNRGGPVNRVGRR